MNDISVTNISNSTFVFTLYHDLFCVSAPCECKTEEILRSVEGGFQYQTVRTPVGVYLEPGETRNFSAAINSIPQVAEAHKRGILQVKTNKNLKTSDPAWRA